ncbi:MAG TPA: hypothetical protein PKA00_22205 [Saprospiraceae bacterium]|nr:hypothetical protein [Saprospiraceae bacterium]HMQ85642.1 hypothetical protein [Saprospiraceae bacterium]
MLHKCALITVTVLLIQVGLLAQTTTDALRYSSYTVGMTARSLGSGGALGALGADFSVASTNPAGLAQYRSSEFVFSPTFFTKKTASTLTNDEALPSYEDSRTNFNLNTIGFVANSQPRNPDWRTSNFAIGLNRLANFHQDFFYRGTSEGSILDRFKEQANGSGISDFESGVAIDSDALYDFDGDGFYENDFDLSPGALVEREQEVIARGAINELVFSLAGNYKDRLMIGATVGIPFLSYRESKTYLEVDPGEGVDGNVLFFDDLEFGESLTTTGVGVNLKLGMIYRASQELRLGLAAHTPTAFTMEDNYNTNMAYRYTVYDLDNQPLPLDGSAESPDGIFSYRLQTPWRIIGSAGFIYQKMGFLSAEIELVDYANNRFKYDGFTDEELEVNDNITKTLGTAWNLRLGGELAYEVFRFRVGYGLEQSPFENDDTMNSSISFGVGMRGENAFLDFGYRQSTLKESYIPYLTFDAPEQIVDQDIKQTQLMLTVGFRF